MQMKSWIKQQFWCAKHTGLSTRFAHKTGTWRISFSSTILHCVYVNWSYFRNIWFVMVLQDTDRSNVEMWTKRSCSMYTYCIWPDYRVIPEGDSLPSTSTYQEWWQYIPGELLYNVTTSYVQSGVSSLTAPENLRNGYGVCNGLNDLIRVLLTATRIPHVLMCRTPCHIICNNRTLYAQYTYIIYCPGYRHNAYLHW